MAYDSVQETGAVLAALKSLLSTRPHCRLPLTTTLSLVLLATINGTCPSGCVISKRIVTREESSFVRQLQVGHDTAFVPFSIRLAASVNKKC